jgi:hypothetical protein
LRTPSTPARVSCVKIHHAHPGKCRLAPHARLTSLQLLNRIGLSLTSNKTHVVLLCQNSYHTMFMTWHPPFRHVRVLLRGHVPRGTTTALVTGQRMSPCARRQGMNLIHHIDMRAGAARQAPRGAHTAPVSLAPAQPASCVVCAEACTQCVKQAMAHQYTYMHRNGASGQPSRPCSMSEWGQNVLGWTETHPLVRTRLPMPCALRHSTNATQCRNHSQLHSTVACYVCN